MLAKKLTLRIWTVSFPTATICDLSIAVLTLIQHSEHFLQTCLFGRLCALNILEDPQCLLHKNCSYEWVTWKIGHFGAPLKLLGTWMQSCVPLPTAWQQSRVRKVLASTTWKWLTIFPGCGTSRARSYFTEHNHRALSNAKVSSNRYDSAKHSIKHGSSGHPNWNA